MIVKLSKPIPVGDELVNELDLREPTVDDVVDIGFPYAITESGEIELRPKLIMKYASKLASVPPSAIKAISIADLNNLSIAVVGFFGDAAATQKG
jgi:hypothetical protein